MIANAWFDRATSNSVACTEDPTATSIAFGGATGAEHHSPKNLLASSFADQLREQTHGAAHIMSLSLKPRSAIGMAGHAGQNTMVVWLEDRGVFATSSAYTSTPWPEIDAYVKAHPISRDFNQVWTRLLPEQTYKFDDDAVGEAPPAGWGRTFPHALASSNDDKAAAARATALNWQHSPWSDAYLADMAASLVGSLRLGQGDTPDMLAVSFSALDMVGHPYGPRSHEIQDMLLRLDATLGKLFDALDQQVGRDKYVVAFSADHGIALIPEQAAELDFNAGRISAAQLRNVLDQAGQAIAGGSVVANITPPHIYLTPAINEKIRTDPEAKRVLSNAIRNVPGIDKVYWADELRSTAPTKDATLTAARRSYVSYRGGDLMYLPKKYWMSVATGTTHGSPYDYDQQVPLIFMGAPIKSGSYRNASGPMDIAPTLARLVGVKMLKTDGRPLTEALIHR
jgi:hypothetical protein